MTRVQFEEILKKEWGEAYESDLDMYSHAFAMIANYMHVKYISYLEIGDETLAEFYHDTWNHLNKYEQEVVYGSKA